MENKKTTTTEKQEINRIKIILKEQGRSQKWLAGKIERSYVIVTNYCNNNNQPTLPILMKTAEVLDVDVRELIVSNRINSSN